MGRLRHKTLERTTISVFRVPPRTNKETNARNKTRSKSHRKPFPLSFVLRRRRATSPIQRRVDYYPCNWSRHRVYAFCKNFQQRYPAGGNSMRDRSSTQMWQLTSPKENQQRQTQTLRRLVKSNSNSEMLYLIQPWSDDQEFDRFMAATRETSRIGQGAMANSVDDFRDVRGQNLECVRKACFRR